MKGEYINFHRRTTKATVSLTKQGRKEIEQVRFEKQKREKSLEFELRRLTTKFRLLNQKPTNQFNRNRNVGMNNL